MPKPTRKPLAAGAPAGRNMSKQAAIDEARAQVSALRHIEPGRWGYHVWSSREGAWIPALRTEEYANARRKRAGSIAAIAAYSLLSNGSDTFNERVAWRVVQLAYGPRTTGSVRDRLNQILDAL